MVKLDHAADCVGIDYMEHPPHAWKPKLIRHSVVKILVAEPKTKVKALVPVLKDYCRAAPTKRWANKVRLAALNWISGISGISGRVRQPSKKRVEVQVTVSSAAKRKPAAAAVGTKSKRARR